VDQNKQQLAFISYRRNDTAGAALWLNRAIEQTFGPARVFTDTQAIRAADNWRERIQAALAASTVLIVVIGPHWLLLTDEFGRRRIDLDEDWVRVEIRHALSNQTPIIPVLINSQLPTPPALPSDIRGMLDFQAFTLAEERWESDLARLLSDLEVLGFKRAVPPPIRYPVPHVSIAELSPTELDTALSGLPGWIAVSAPLPGKEPLTRTELHKRFEFDSFELAIDFMMEVRPLVTELQHHPRWENTWKTISIWLSTWDIGHKPSTLDIKLAGLIENAYRNFEHRTEQL
jgi:pterin-4a-carbinolamine dehydratase